MPKIKRKCERCGTGFEIYPSSLKDGRGGRYCSPSCRAKMNALKHGDSGSRLHNIWCGMKARCSPTNKQIASTYYHDRGISVCMKWRDSFESFRDWSLSHGYKTNLELDRKDPHGNYDPSNCRWATRKQQMQNTRKRRSTKGTSNYKGVAKYGKGLKWRATITQKDKPKHLGVFESEKEAAKAYDAAARALFGKFASCNFKE